MSQWGTEKKVNGATFIPDVETDTFAPAHGFSLIGGVIMLDDGGDPQTAYDTEAKLIDKFVGRPYAEWLAWCPTVLS